ncbi:MAG: glucose 1-dehydrogenase [Candidatus Aminicenantes bacterium]|nr:glucose 1-dehydrogenase [Candidatus Aminicenantes bacterium]
MFEELKGKVVVITGATSGIGYASAKKFAELGAKIFITGRNEEVLKELNDELNSKTESGFISGDLSDQKFREILIENTINKFSGLDVLVNSAGIIGSGSIENTPMEEYDRMMDINLRSIFHLTQISIPHLEKTEGNIVNVSSITGLRAFPGVISYCISKAGLDQLTRSAALELAPKKIRVNAINPGVVETKLHLNSGMDSDKYEDFKEHGKDTHPIGRIGNPEEVAELIVFLASENASWITGVTYSIDGGRQLTCAR